MKFIGLILIFFCALFAIDFIVFKFLGSHPFSLSSIQVISNESMLIPQKLWCNFQGKEFVFTSSYLDLKRNGECSTRVTDGGDSCQSGSECQSGKCFVGKEVDVANKDRLIGRCGNTGETNNCQFAEIEQGKIITDLRGAICD